MRNFISFKLVHHGRYCCRIAATLSLLMYFGGLIHAQNQTINPPRKWATSIGGANLDFISDAVSDGQGGLYVTGYTNSPNFPTTLVGSPGSGYDVFVARYDSLGAVIWSTRLGGSGNDFGQAIARDGAGNVVVAGKLGGQGTFVTDSTYKGIGDDILVLKLSSTGNLLGAARYGGSAADEAVGVSVGSNGHIVVVGNSSSSDIPTSSALYNGTSGDAFVLRLRSNLSRHWAFRYGGNSFDKANDVVVEAATGNIYVGGETGSSNFQQTIATYQGSGGAKGFVLRLDSLGTRAWAQRYGGSGVERVYALHLPPTGGLLVAGYTTSSDFPLTIAGLGGSGLDAFLLNLNLDGTRGFARRLGGSLDDLGNDIATDLAGNIFMTGETQSLNFPSSNNAYKGAGRDQFVSKFGAAGNYIWSFPYGGLSDDFVGGGLTSDAASVYLAGHTQSINYPQTLPGTGGNTARGAVLRMRDCVGQNADFIFQHVCEFDTVQFTNLSVRGTSDTIAHRWWFGDGDSSDVVHPSHYYASPGRYNVRLRVTSPCGVDSDITKVVNVYPAPRVDFGHPLACETRGIAFVDSTVLDTTVGSFIASWVWAFGDGGLSAQQNPTHSYAFAGDYAVHFTVTSNHGCADSLVDTVRVHHRPAANFGVTDICLRDSAMFRDSTLLGGDSLTTWAWDFGTLGATASVQNPAYVYLTADTFAVRLITTTNEGCSDTMIKPIKVLPLPMVNFGMTAVCWPDAVTYTDSSSIVGDLIAGYVWHFGDNLSDTLQNTQHSYAAAGEYDVVLWVLTASGCADSLRTTLNVHDKPTADFSAPAACWPEAINFSDGSAVAGDSLVTWSWAFGDGDIASTQSPSHLYALPNTYSASLEVISSFGCRDTIVKNVTVHPKPTAFFAPSNVCFPLPLSLTDGSTVSSGAITGWNWNFGDGSTGFLPFTAHLYANAGSYIVTLIATTADGCRDTIQDSVEIYAQPAANFGVENVCDGDTVFFTDSSSVSNGVIAQYAYTFGDGNGANAANPTWIYAQPGTYVVSETVTSDNNCIAIAVNTVTVYALPNPDPMVVGYPDICVGDTVRLQEVQIFPHYNWETGDTNNSIGIQGRSDWVVLTVTDANSCTNSDSVQVRFHNVPRPEAVVTPDPNATFCSNDNSFVNAGGSYFSYNWSTGATAPSTIVAQSGPVSVIVTNGFGCTDTSETVNFTILQSPATPLITQVGNVLSTTAATTYQWYLNGLAIPNATAQQYTALATGNYAVAVTNGNACATFSTAISTVVGSTPEFFTEFSLFPNPCGSEAHLRGMLKKGGSMQIRLLNATGQVIWEDTVAVSAGVFEHVLETRLLPAGYYVCQMTLGKDMLHRVVVKQ